MDLIYSELDKLMERIRQEGFVPDLSFVLHDEEGETKEKMLYAHSEKLAIVFGLMNLGHESLIRITKNSQSVWIVILLQSLSLRLQEGK
ncbi:hypothetical protein CRYUN_Cryun15aG0000500 [Craigia yunnanensis]